MNAKLIKSLSVFTDAELFEISGKYFGYFTSDICKVIDRIESAMYFDEFCLDNVLKEYGKTNFADERPERVYSGLTAKELRNFFVQNISKYDCIEKMLTETYGKKGFCIAFGIEWESYDEAMEVLTKYTTERPERVNEPNNVMKPTYFSMSCCGEHIATLFAETETQLHQKVLTALEEHFDTEVTVCGQFEFDNIINCDPHEFKAIIDGDENLITIQQTWMY